MLIVPQTYLRAETFRRLTREEAEAWLKTITWEELLDLVIKYDAIEHATPRFSPFDYSCVVTDRDILVIPVPQQIDLTIADLQYSIKIPTVEFKNVIPKPTSMLWTGFGIGIGAGVVATSLLMILVLSLGR